MTYGQSLVNLKKRNQKQKPGCKIKRMNKKIYTVTDLGGGDGGKGGVVHALCATQHPHTVIKVGGTQGSHGVRTSRGENFNFSQFGCGTFEGIATFISKNFVASPLGLLNEANSLKYKNGVSDPFSLLTIDEHTLCTTPYHGRASRIKELARKDNPRSIVGTGAGEAYMDLQLHPELALRISDLLGSFEHKLKLIRAQKYAEIEAIAKDSFLAADMKLLEQEMDVFNDEGYFDWIVERFRYVAKELRIVDEDYLRKTILHKDGIAVIESSHGILTDYLKGLSPHTSRLRTLPQISSWGLLEENDYDGQVVRLGVTRAHQIMHGAGPFVVDDESMAQSLYGGSYELDDPDRYRGRVRVGPLDTVLLRYALAASGGASLYDGICLTWFDSMSKLGTWPVCYSYNNTDPRYVSDNGTIMVKDCVDEGEQLSYQTALTQSLYNCTPSIKQHCVPPNASHVDIAGICKAALDDTLGVPIRMIGIGPTENQKILI
jgi:adenylosuccinate synthase